MRVWRQILRQRVSGIHSITLFTNQFLADVEAIYLENKRETLDAKTSILQLKAESLQKDIQKEKDWQTKMLEGLPIQLNAQNANEHAANVAVQNALKELEDFYTLCKNNENNGLSFVYLPKYSFIFTFALYSKHTARCQG